MGKLTDLKLIFEHAVRAKGELANMNKSTIDEVLRKLAYQTELHCEELIAANRRDLDYIEPNSPKYDRLLLTKERIEAIAADLRHVADLPSPVGEVLSENIRPNGMKIIKQRVPFGVIGVIYEARPNVSFDVFALCFKTQNAVMLKGSGDAQFSNKVIVQLIREVLESEHINPNMVNLLSVNRRASEEMLRAKDYIDLIIPRGSAALIDFVRKNSLIPVIETGAGVCHTYFDKYGDVEKGAGIIFNAKTRRVSVCNALDTLLVHVDSLRHLPELCNKLAEKQVVIYADKPAYKSLEDHYPSYLLKMADKDSFGVEFLDYKMAVKTVLSIKDAMKHITEYSSKHSECIITESEMHAEIFTKTIDAACVYVNVSTAFTDGAQFGFGAEIGISTQKLHARGPMGLNELTGYKYIIMGDGQTRN